MITVFECTGTNSRESVWESDGGETIAAHEHTVANGGETGWEGEGGEPTAALERSIANFCQSIWESEGGESIAVSECTGLNLLESVWKCDGDQISAVVEGPFSDCVHPSRHGNGARSHRAYSNNRSMFNIEVECSGFFVLAGRVAHGRNLRCIKKQQQQQKPTVLQERV